MSPGEHFLITYKADHVGLGNCVEYAGECLGYHYSGDEDDSGDEAGVFCSLGGRVAVDLGHFVVEEKGVD